MTVRIKRLLDQLAVDRANPKILRELFAATAEDPDARRMIEEILRWLRR